ncbi:CDP-glycerol glycerophosphotransferase family protein [Latilactobacillus fragifolii]|uniref:CDP-glycerol glycerophosphotransferase family protein n=1 Tax=Latilactobacillus fragifolii TaxID=2814244 RepID=UPI001ABAF63D|nr:CDP-glycerol glycerophosphotransferase family protein [Latilactobacillus fragifolii]
MKSIIKNFVKENNLLGWLFVQFTLFVYNILDKCIRPDEKQIIFTSYSGRQFSDSPKAIYISMKDDPKFKGYKFIWGLKNIEEFPEIPIDERVNIDSFSFFITLFKSKYWVSNSSIERLIPIDSDKHIYINTWHGVPLKHLGPDEDNLSYTVKNWYKKVKFDLLVCSGEYDKKIFSRIFENTDNIQNVGLPRNESLVHDASNSYSIKKKLLEELNLDSSKEILLYAPTFREYDLNISTESNRFFEKDSLSKIQKKYNVLVRGHYFSSDNMTNNSVVDVSDYSNLNDLMIGSDVLVSDYSSIIFDYLLLGKPIFLYMYDYSKYKAYRGLYFDPKNSGFNCSMEINELVNELLQTNSKRYKVIDKYNTLSSPISVIKDKIVSTSAKF